MKLKNSFLIFYFVVSSIFGGEINKRSIIRDSWDPWTFPIKYFVEYYVDQLNVEKALDMIRKTTCITFQKSNKALYNERGLIFKWSRDSCHSNVGSEGSNKPNSIYLTYGCQNVVGLIVHEICHSLGLIHEHTRPDRDLYVYINDKNIKVNDKNNFNIINFEGYHTYNTSYDYGSIMHYNGFDFATDSTFPTIIPKLHIEYINMIGQHSYLFFNDIKKLNLCHCNNCSWIDHKTGKKNTNYKGIKCKNSGYPDYKNCSRCICPTGFVGKDCKDVQPNQDSCGPNKIDVDNEKEFVIKGKMNCTFYIKNVKNGRLNISVDSLYVPASIPCMQGYGLEVKYRKDKGAVGLLLCHTYIFKSITTEGRDALIIYNGLIREHHLKLYVKSTNLKT